MTGVTVRGDGKGAVTVGAAVLRVEELRVAYHTPRGAVRAVEGVSFALGPGERLGLVGESGSGKTTIGLAVLRLIKPPGRIEGGRILLGETDLLALPPEAMRQVRLARIALVAQGAMNSLNPVRRVQDQLLDAFADHGQALPAGQVRAHLSQLLDRVGLAPSVARMYPHELSGGMKQRVVIAIAIALRPQLIVADEPTSALDVVVQRQIMATLQAVQAELGAAVLLIGHDMGLMAQAVDRLGVLYAGELVELSPIAPLFAAPRHPYTRRLIAALPDLRTKGHFQGIPGLPPSLLAKPPGCPFAPRCDRVLPRCRHEPPRLRLVGAARWVACHLEEGAPA